MSVLRVLSVIFLLIPMTLTSTSAYSAEASVAEQRLVLRFAVLGDAEPKPKAEFPGVSAAVDDVNRLAQDGTMDFVVGVGDIAHKGTVLQYENVTPVLQRLTLPLYPETYIWIWSG